MAIMLKEMCVSERFYPLKCPQVGDSASKTALCSVVVITSASTEI